MLHVNRLHGELKPAGHDIDRAEAGGPPGEVCSESSSAAGVMQMLGMSSDCMHCIMVYCLLGTCLC